MFGDKFCSIAQNVHVRHRRTNTQFLKNIMQEEQQMKAVRAQEILMTSENPMVKEQKLCSQLCSEMQVVERDKFLEEKRKARLHQNEADIRQLDVQIKRAHIQAELAEQKALKERELKEAVQARLEENKRFEEECERNKEIAREEEKKSAQKRAAFRQDILKQMQERDRKRQMERETILKERESMKRFVENLQQDTENEQKNMLQLKEAAKQDREQYMRQVKLFKAQQKEDAQEDHRKYVEMIRKRDETERLRIEQRKENSRKRAALSERIGQQVYAVQMEKQKHNDLLLELLIEERLAKNDERFKMNLGKQLQTARALHEDFQRSLVVGQQEKLFKKEEEMQVVKEQLKRYHEQERKEMDVKNTKLLKSRQYCRELLQTVKNKSRLLELEAEQNKLDYEQQILMQQQRQQEIETEKLRLLRAEPLEILKFLPVKAISLEHRLELGLTCKETKDKEMLA